MNLMDGEQVQLESNSLGLTLTNYRVRYQTKALGSGSIKSIMLEEIASCSMVHTSNPILLIFAGVFLLIGILLALTRSEQGLILGIILAVVFAIIWAVTRRQVLSFASAGAVIIVNVAGIKPEEIESFIDRTEKVKNERFFSMRIR
jgi:Peptidase M50B-like